MPASATPTLDLNDIQGFILRGYHMLFTRHFMLNINNVAATKNLLAQAVDENADFLQVTSATPWTDGKPDYCLNIGLSHVGISKLIDTSDVTFPGQVVGSNPAWPFKEGAVAAAKRVGDIGQSAPDKWIGGLGTDEVHIVFTLNAMDLATLDKYSAILRAGFEEQQALSVLHCFDAAAFSGDKIHFGYKDGIAQPQIAGGPAGKLADAQLAVQSWQFVLQQVDKTIEINRDCNYTIDDNEKTLLVNGSFAAFRVLEQNVVAFEKYLEDNTDKIPSETLAAKMCGRWRDGSPLELDPFHDQPVAPEDINNFNYKNDVKGYRCPISSHIRRTNPRDQRIQGGNDGEGKSVRNNRIMRRAMPYGPEYTPGAGDDGINRGLVGMFICANLATQFEFIMSHWVHDGQFAGSKPKGKDPLLGNNDPSDSIFNIPIENATPLNLEGFPQFIATRGSAYLFLPSFTGLKYIADAPAV